MNTRPTLVLIIAYSTVVAPRKAPRLSFIKSSATHFTNALRAQKLNLVKCMLFYMHYGDVRMGAIASQITSLTIVYSTVYSDADQSKHQSTASLAFVRGIHRGPVNSPHKWLVTRKMFPFDDVIMENIMIKTIVSQLCIINDSCVIVTCAKLLPDWTLRFKIRSNTSLTMF